MALVELSLALLPAQLGLGGISAFGVGRYRQPGSFVGSDKYSGGRTSTVGSPYWNQGLSVSYLTLDGDVGRFFSDDCAFGGVLNRQPGMFTEAPKFSGPATIQLGASYTRYAVSAPATRTYWG